MNHLERREQTNGWVIVSRPSYETANIRKSFPKERPVESSLDALYDRPAQATFRVDSDSKDEDYFSASDYRSAYYGGA